MAATASEEIITVNPLGAGLHETQLQQELSAALEQQAATREILRVIASSPHDVRPVFETIAKSAARLCRADFAGIYQFDGALIHFMAHHGLSPEAIEEMGLVYPL